MTKQNKIKIIAHRGWSAGKGENTLESFKRSAAKTGVDGIEIDIRWCKKRNDIIISHNLDIECNAMELEEGLKFLSEEKLELFIEMKEFDENLFNKLIKLLNKYNLKQRTMIFGFRDVAIKFHWDDRKGIKFGIISEYPWEIKGDMSFFKPDSVLIGWNEYWYTKFIFKLIWTIFSLPNICKKYNNVDFIVGVATSKKDYDWLCKQSGLYCLTADKPLEWI